MQHLLAVQRSGKLKIKGTFNTVTGEMKIIDGLVDTLRQLSSSLERDSKLMERLLDKSH